MEAEKITKYNYDNFYNNYSFPELKIAIIRKINEQIQENISELTGYKEWVDLLHIAKQAQNNAIKVLKKINKELSKESLVDIIRLYKIQLAVLKMSIPDLEKVFKSEFLSTFN